MNLDPDQRRAVEHLGGPLLVLAGPGTGKTGVLISRVAHLVEERKVEPRRILALTFSRRAAEEMQSRILARSPEAADVEVRTFHSFALRLVRRHHRRLGFERPPDILPTARQWATIKDLLKDEDPIEWDLAPNAFDRSATVREVYDLMLRAQEHLKGPKELREFGERHDRPYLSRAGDLLERYRHRLREDSEVDYERVVQLAIELLRSLALAGSRESGVGSGAVLDSLHFDTLASTLDEPSINSRGDSDGENPDAVPFPTPGLYDRYDHVLVDEFQDTNGSQLELLKLLMPADSPNVFCVGDDAQSIYGFRGARAENVGEFEEDFPDAKVVHLGTNYRSAQPVVTLAEAALAREKTTREREKQKVPDDRTGAVLHHVAASARDEGAWISDRIAELSQVRGVPFEQIAILRRSLLDADPLVEALKARSIPVDFSSASGRTSARRLAILLAASAGDDPSPKDASRALVSPLAGVLPETALALRAVAESSSLSVFGMVRENSFPAGVSEKEKDRARKVVATVDAARGRDGFLEKLDVLWKGLPGTRELFEAHRGDPDCAMALSDAAAFLRSARSYAAASREPSVRGFLAAGEMIHDDSDTWAPSAPTVEGAVRILTVHASKGLEFEAVFLSGLSDEKFPIRSRGVRFVDPGILAGKGPTPKANLEEIHLNEERRLFYVALTRAKTRLYLTGVEETADDGRKASPFLRELEDLLVKLAAPESSRRFWTSREEAVEELRRLACDRTSPDHDRFAACRALAEMDERPDDPDDPWWRYVEETEGKGPPPENGVLSEREVVDLSECPRRAFLERLTSRAGRRMSGGSASFGAAFSDGLRAFLLGEHDSLEEAVRAAVEASKFGGAAFTEHWLREARNMAVGCEAWAREVRRLLVEPGGEWEREFAGRKVRGRHGPVIEREGKTVALRISTGGSHLTKKEAATDAGLSLKALGAGAEEAEIHYAREVQKRSGAPKRVTLDASKGWRERFEEDVQTWLEELAAGEHPPRPKDEKLCDRCAFKNVCPRHREDEVWVG